MQCSWKSPQPLNAERTIDCKTENGKFIAANWL